MTAKRTSAWKPQVGDNVELFISKGIVTVTDITKKGYVVKFQGPLFDSEFTVPLRQLKKTNPRKLPPPPL